MDTYTRTYSYKLDWQANAGKLVELEALYEECVRVRPLINQQLLAIWAKTGELPQALKCLRRIRRKPVILVHLFHLKTEMAMYFNVKCVVRKRMQT